MHRHAGLVSASLMLALASVIASCSSPTSQAARAPVVVNDRPQLGDEAPRDYAGLHNVVAFHDDFYSGSVPEGDAGFAALVALGVKTIISVDGATPDIAAARAHGMHYVHLPIAYNGFDEQRKLELVRATRDSISAGPVYVHCHHGKHRSAAAAGTIAASLGWADPEAMVRRMRVSGTSQHYEGLYETTAHASPVSMAMIDTVGPEFPEVSRPAGLVRTMVDIDHVTEHLRALEAAGWQAPREHPDLVAAAEAGRMADLFRLLDDDEQVRRYPEDFGAMLRDGGEHVQVLEDMIVASAAPSDLSAQFELVLTSCRHCHRAYRDVR